jgi:hypothetical protein
MAKMRESSTSPREAEVLSAPDGYLVRTYQGWGRWAEKRTATLVYARYLARASDRSVVYARKVVDGVEHIALVTSGHRPEEAAT